jgi:hypothetical protein
MHSMSDNFTDVSSPGNAGQSSRKDSETATSSGVKNRARRAKKVVAASSSTVIEQAKKLLDRQISARGGAIVGSIASALEAGATDLRPSSPSLAKLADNLVERARSYESGLQKVSLDQLTEMATRVTRRNPALVFGLTAFAGFLAMRVIKSGPVARAESELEPSTGSAQSFERPATF